MPNDVRVDQRYWREIGIPVEPKKSALHKKRTLCVYCEHLHSGITSSHATCDAFPKGIPNSFWKGNADHTTPYDGDNGTTFEPRSS